jgi:ribosomal protein L7/L12
MTPETDGGVDSEVVALARSGQKIEAIKRYRELTGAGLAEAKQAVEAL